MRGKNKCKILKEIRQRIADENDIPYVTRECSYQGECSGTCPRCEAELRYLEQQLARRQALGRTVTVAALAASLSLGLSGCVPSVPAGMTERDPAAITLPQLETETIDTGGEPTELDGEIAPPDPTMTMGMLPLETKEAPTSEDETWDLTGDYAELPNASLGDLPPFAPSDGETLPVETVPVEPASVGDLGSNG